MKRRIIRRILFIIFFVSSSNLWGMVGNLKSSLTELSVNLKELKNKNELLVTKLGLLKDRLEGKDVTGAPSPGEESPLDEVKLGGGISTDGLVQGVIDRAKLQGAVNAFYDKLYLLNATQKEDGPVDDLINLKTDFLKQDLKGNLSEFSKDVQLIIEQKKYFAEFFGSLSSFSDEQLFQIKDICKDYEQTLVNIYGPYEKIWGGEIAVVEQYAMGMKVNPIDSSNDGAIIASMKALVDDGYVNAKAGNIVSGVGVEQNKKFLQSSADYITEAILEGKVTDSEVLKNLLPLLTMRTQSLIVAYALLSNQYSEPSFLKWATGAILWYSGQHYSGARKYKNLAVICLSHLIKVITGIADGFDEKTEAVTEACDLYMLENAGKSPKVEVVGSQTPGYTDAPKGFTFEGRTIKRQLLTLIHALRCMKGIDKELEKRMAAAKVKEEEAAEAAKKAKEEEEIRIAEEQATKIKEAEEAAKKAQAEKDQAAQKDAEEALKKAQEEATRLKKEADAKKELQEKLSKEAEIASKVPIVLVGKETKFDEKTSVSIIREIYRKMTENKQECDLVKLIFDGFVADSIQRNNLNLIPFLYKFPKDLLLKDSENLKYFNGILKYILSSTPTLETMVQFHLDHVGCLGKMVGMVIRLTSGSELAERIDVNFIKNNIASVKSCVIDGFNLFKGVCVILGPIEDINLVNESVEKIFINSSMGFKAQLSAYLRTRLATAVKNKLFIDKIAQEIAKKIASLSDEKYDKIAINKFKDDSK